MKYRLENYKDGQETVGQTFDQVVPEYKLDEKTNQLVQIGTKDLQELIQSSADCALKAILDKFGGLIPEGMQNNVPVVGETDEIGIAEMKDDLDYYNEVLDFQEDLRERYHFDDTMTLQQMIDEINKMSVKQNAEIVKKMQKKEVDQNEKKKVD